MKRFWNKVDKRGPTECWPWAASLKNDYGSFWLQGANDLAHRVAWQMTHGPIIDGLVVRHKCDNPLCCNPEHLELGTPADNTRDMVRRGRASRRALKLTAEDACNIRKAYNTGRFLKSELAALAGVSGALVGQIIRGKRWATRS